MSKLNLIFFIITLIALSTASQNRHLRLLNEEERELQDDSTTKDNEEPASSATTSEPEVTTTTSSDKPSDTTTTEPTEGTTSNPPDESSSSSSAPTVSPSGDKMPEIPKDIFDCYFTADQYPTADGKKFKFKAITCNTPKIEETTTPSSSESKSTPTIKINNIESKTAVIVDNNKECLYTFSFEIDFEVSDSKVEVSYLGNTTTVQLGCNVGKNMHKAGDDIKEGVCDITKFQSGNYSGKCLVNVKENKQIFELDLYEDDEYSGCNCTVEWKGGVSDNSPKPIDHDNKTIGVIYNDFSPCKNGEKISIECSVNGWKYVTASDINKCQWDNGSISSTVSSLLLVLVMIFSIFF